MIATPRFEALHRMQDEAIERARHTLAPRWSGDGMVIVAGGGRSFVNAYVNVTMLRRDSGFGLPIQIWHLGPDEFNSTMRSLLKPLDVEIVDAFEIRRKHPVRRLGGWECKPYAVLHSPFERVLLLDADNNALRNPAMLFDAPEFERTGALMWPDCRKLSSESLAWELFRVPVTDCLEVESGQLLVDKSRSWEALNLAMHVCEWSDLYWQFINGDKEAFHLAWRHLDQEFAMPARPPDELFARFDTPSGLRSWCAAFRQYGFDDQPLFNHRVGAEWVLYGENRSVAGSQSLERRALDILTDLGSRWDGSVRADPPRASRVDGREVASTMRYFYRRPGIEERIITMHPDGTFGPGAHPNDRHWRIDTVNGTDELVLSLSRREELCRLTWDPSGHWSGHWSHFEKGPMQLFPLDPGTDTW